LSAKQENSMQPSHSNVIPTPIAVPGQASVVIQALLAMALGVLIVGVVGFSHIGVVHNAAHDTRHSNAFPCH
jgi:cobalt transporter subunit CbtB